MSLNSAEPPLPVNLQPYPSPQEEPSIHWIPLSCCSQKLQYLGSPKTPLYCVGYRSFIVPVPVINQLSPSPVLSL